MTASHWHCYRWTGERRTYDDESTRRPPHLVVHDITPQEWKQIAAASPGFMTDHDKDPARQAERFTAAGDRLSWGGDVVGGWYLRGTGFASVHVVACSANRIRPTIPCPVR